MSEKVSKNKKKGGDKPKQKSNKNKLIIVIIVASVITLAAITPLIISLAISSTKSYAEVEKALNRAGYDTYFKFGSNTYDKDGKCYKYDYSERETCKREIGTYDSQSAWIIAVGNDGKNEITSYYYLGNDEETKTKAKLSISIEKEVNDDEQYSYTFDRNGKTDYLWYYKSGGKDCYIINKMENDDGDYTICSGDAKKALLEYQKEANDLLKELGLSKGDLFVYFSEYAETYARPKYEEAKTALETKLPYSAIKKYIEEAGYTIAKLGDAVTIYDYITSSLYKQFIFYFDDDGKNTGNLYNYTSYKDYSLIYMPDYSSYMGKDKSGSCSYLVGEHIELEAAKDGVLPGSYCSEKDKERITYLWYSYKSEIEDMSVTRDELFDFVAEYYKKN